MKSFRLLAAAFGVTLGFAASSASAFTVFSENFDGLGPGGIPYASPGIFTVLSGTVDVIPLSGGQYNLQPGHGLYLDMDGTGGSPSSNGTILTTKGYDLTAGNYTLSFDYAGDNRGYGGNGLLVFATIGSDTATRFTLTQIFPVASGTQFTTVNLAQTLPFDLKEVHIGFTSLGTADQQGVLLDNVSLYSGTGVPDGGSMASLLGLTFAGLAGVRRFLGRS